MFAVHLSEIEHFDGTKLVELLRVLMYAEARKAGVPMRNVDVPLQITVATMLAWVDQDPDNRVAFLLSFYQILEQVEEVWCWHPALQTLADRYGDRAPFRTALRSRILPGSWGGSLSAHLDSSGRRWRHGKVRLVLAAGRR